MAAYYRPSKQTATGKEYEQIQDVAKQSKIGMWSDPNLVMPNEFRKKNDAEKIENIGKFKKKIFKYLNF